MKERIPFIPLLTIALSIMSVFPAQAQQATAPAATPQSSTVKTTAEEVLLDMIVRDKKGKPITDLKPGDVTVLDNGVKQTVTSFRLVQGTEAISSASGAKTTLDPLRQLRLVTLAFEALGAPDQRLRARQAALDLIKGEQGTNVFYSVVVINTRLFVLQQFTKDQAALSKAIESATSGYAATRLTSESETIQAELKRNLNGQTVNGADQDVNLLMAAVQTASQPLGPGMDPTQVLLARIMLDMLRLDAGAATYGTRMSLSAIESLIQGLQPMPGRKSVLYFTAGMVVEPELDFQYRQILGQANRANVTFYSVDTEGTMVASRNAGAMSQLNSANAASARTSSGVSGAVSKDEVNASENAETAGRNNTQLKIRELAESTGGFLIGESNDLRAPLRQVNEEIASYYELSYNPGITNYDGKFRAIKVEPARKDLVIHARTGYLALSPEVRASGMQAFELPVLKAISDGKLSSDVGFRAGPVLLRRKDAGTDMTVLVEVPLHGLQPKPEPGKTTQSVHFSLGALVKDSKGEVVQRLTRDRSIQVTAEQLKAGNFVERLPASVGPGKYTLETAVLDQESGKVGVQRTEFVAGAGSKGVAISSLTSVRGYTPNAKGLDPNETFQFQGGAITPTLDTTVIKSPDASIRMFFTVYQDPAIAAHASVEIEFLLNGQTLAKIPMELPAPDAQGRIPYVMTIPAASIPPGTYVVHATAKQGDSAADTRTEVTVQAN